MATTGQGNLGFGLAFVLEDLFSATADHIQAKMNAFMGNMHNRVEEARQSTMALYAGLTLMGTGVATMMPFGSSIMKASDFEQTQIAMESIIGSASRAKDLINDMKGMSLKTPFNYVELINYSKQLLAAGVNVNDMVKDMTTLGNIAAGVGKDKLDNIVYAFGQIRTQGWLIGQDLRQLVNAGVPILEVLAQRAGKSVRQFKADMDKGIRPLFEEVRAALEQLANTKFNNLMERQMGTVSGILSNIQDAIFQLQVAIGNALMPEMRALATSLMEAVSWLKEFAETALGQTVIRVLATTTAVAALILIFRGLGLVLLAVKAQLLQTIIAMRTFITTSYIGKLLLQWKGAIDIFRIARLYNMGFIASLKESALWLGINSLLMGGFFLALTAGAAVAFMWYRKLQEGVELYHQYAEGSKTLAKMTDTEKSLTALGVWWETLVELVKSYNKETGMMEVNKDLATDAADLGQFDKAVAWARWWAGVADFVSWMFEKISNAFSSLAAGFGNLFSAMDDAFSKALGMTGELKASQYILIGILAIVIGIPAAFLAIVTAIVLGLTYIVTTVIGIIGIVLGWFKDLFGVLMGIPDAFKSWGNTLQWVSSLIWKLLIKPITLLLDLITLGKFNINIGAKSWLNGQGFDVDGDMRKPTLEQPKGWELHTNNRILTDATSQQQSQAAWEAHRKQELADRANYGKEPIIIQNHLTLDGEKVAESVNKVNADRDSRYGYNY